jgi:hypothetical protein
MSSYQRISYVIDDMINKVKRQNTTKYHKPHFLRILVNNQVVFKRTLNQTLRDNDQIIKDLWLKEMNVKTVSNYYTILGESIINYLNDDLENDLLSLTHDERQKLIQKINKDTFRK